MSVSFVPTTTFKPQCFTGGSDSDFLTMIALFCKALSIQHLVAEMTKSEHRSTKYVARLLFEGDLIH